MYSRSIRSAVIAPEPNAMSQRSPQLPEVTSVHGGETKQASTSSSRATSFVTSMSYPVTSAAVSSLSSQRVSAGRVAPSASRDCGG